LFPDKIFYQFKKINIKKKRFFVQKKKVNIKKFKKKGYSRPTLKNFNKFFLFNHIKNIRFNSAKKKIAKKVDFKNKYNNIKKIKLKK
jgi:hypothetical protein